MYLCNQSIDLHAQLNSNLTASDHSKKGLMIAEKPPLSFVSDKSKIISCINLSRIFFLSENTEQLISKGIYAGLLRRHS